MKVVISEESVSQHEASNSIALPHPPYGTGRVHRVIYLHDDNTEETVYKSLDTAPTWSAVVKRKDDYLISTRMVVNKTRYTPTIISETIKGKKRYESSGVHVGANGKVLHLKKGLKEKKFYKNGKLKESCRFLTQDRALSGKHMTFFKDGVIKSSTRMVPMFKRYKGSSLSVSDGITSSAYLSNSKVLSSMSSLKRGSLTGWTRTPAGGPGSVTYEKLKNGVSVNDMFISQTALCYKDEELVRKIIEEFCAGIKYEQAVEVIHSKIPEVTKLVISEFYAKNYST